MMIATMIDRIERAPAMDITMIREWRKSVERWSQSSHDERYLLVGKKMGSDVRQAHGSVR